MKLNDPKLTLYFLGNDLEPGHETTQILTNEDIVKSLVFKRQRFSSLKSSSDSVQILIRRRCSSTEDIVATDGNIKAVLTDGEQTLFTGYISTNFTWTVTDHGEEALSATIEGVGTRLLSQAYIETGKHFFDGTAASVIYAVVNPLGIVLRSGDERKLLQSVSYTVEAGTTCREILDQLCYECNAVYWFNNLGELCIQQITADTSSAEEVDSDSLVFNGGKAISLSKNLRTYKGARVTYKQLGTANNYLVYRNTTNATSQRTCDLVLQGGEYFDGAEIYTEAEWSEATQDAFREPTLLGAVNAASESSIVGSGKIVNIDNLRADVEKENGLSADFENVGGGYFKLTAHNSASVARAFYRLDLYADIVYEKSDGVIRTTIDGTTEGKTLIEEELEFIHDKENAQKHANLLAQYYRYCGATYTFYTNKQLELGSVIRLHDTTFSGLDVFVLLTATEETEGTSTVKCTGVAISTFDLEADVYHGTTEAAKQSGAQGPAGEPGASTEVQYALGDSIVDPPTAEMLWGGVEMTWNGSVMTWNEGLYSDEVPEMQRGKYIWMRSRVGNGEWNYTRLTGAVSWDAEDLGIATTACPTGSKEGLGLIPGDYFVAGAAFTDGGGTYNAGFAYVYDGTSWDPMDITDVDNAIKAQSLLDDLTSAGIQIPQSSSVYSIWLWAKNFVSQNAVINNLFSQAITILTGGHIKGGTRYDASGTIVNWNADGFWFGANGKLMASLQSDGYGNTYVGTGVAQYTADYGTYNTALGYEALYKIQSQADYNVAIGYQALHENTTGDNNIGIGYLALYSNTTGVQNIAIGSNAAAAITTGQSNIAIGWSAMSVAVGANHNVGIGFRALKSLTSGRDNIAIGEDAARDITTGSENIAIGAISSRDATTGSGNISIGYGSIIEFPTGHNQLVIKNKYYGLHFITGRTYGQIFGVLKDFFSDYETMGCTGTFEGDGIHSITFYDDPDDGEIITLNGYHSNYMLQQNSYIQTTKDSELLIVVPRTEVRDCLS